MMEARGDDPSGGASGDESVGNSKSKKSDSRTK